MPAPLPVHWQKLYIQFSYFLLFLDLPWCRRYPFVLPPRVKALLVQPLFRQRFIFLASSKIHMHNHCPFLSVLNETPLHSHNKLVAHRANYLFCLTKMNFRLVRMSVCLCKTEALFGQFTIPHFPHTQSECISETTSYSVSVEIIQRLQSDRKLHG
jgi:hypothetical protein